MLQRDTPTDYVISTGETTSVRNFIEMAFSEVGIEIAWVESTTSLKTSFTYAVVFLSYMLKDNSNSTLFSASKYVVKELDLVYQTSLTT